MTIREEAIYLARKLGLPEYAAQLAAARYDRASLLLRLSWLRAQ